MNYKPDSTPQECEDRVYWHKRFNFASWLFLIFGLYFILFTESYNSAWIALAASVFWRIVDSFCNIKHLQWHMENQNEGGNHEL